MTRSRLVVFCDCNSKALNHHVISDLISPSFSPTDAPPLSVVKTTCVESFLSPSGSIAARARDAHNARLQASRLPWWRTLGETDAFDLSYPAHLEGLEAELGGLYVGGSTDTR